MLSVALLTWVSRVFNGYSNTLLQYLWLTITALNRARYRRLIDGLFWGDRSNKKPLRRGFDE
ncbi:hypothetical protein SynBIOSE41_03434 [Synechococcus sp. BIOS-E4-1]|nr:hypothetical protein SynBIOSE41_03434 [Synechococcus sp. BIOS-E4-1]